MRLTAEQGERAPKLGDRIKIAGVVYEVVSVVSQVLTSDPPQRQACVSLRRASLNDECSRLIDYWNRLNEETA